ncbi:MAG: glycoside hydrolase family 95 protein [Paludibacteraceae bacterium]
MSTMKKIFICIFINIIGILPQLKAEQPLNLWYNQPAKVWGQAIPVGNGRLGAMIYGGVETETIALNEITMWSGQPDENQELACGKDSLRKIQKLFFEGKIEEGNKLGTKFLSGQPHSFGTHLPVGDLKIKFNYKKDKISNYNRKLDLENSVTTVTYKAGNVNYTREYICSNPDDVLLVKLSSDSKNALNFELSLDLLRESEITVSGNMLSFSGQALFPKLGPGGVHYLGNINVLLKGGNISSRNNTLIIENSNEVVIAIDIRTDFNNPTYKELCNQTIRKATSKSFEELKQAHIKDYVRLFNRTKLDLGGSESDKLPTDERLFKFKKGNINDPELFSLFFQYGRYLLISASRENSPLPANLQGIWNDNLACNMPWTCDYHLDINTEQNYWLANVGNLSECNTPLFNYVESLAKYGEKTAAKVYGCPGWTAHTVANVWGYTAPGQGVSWGLFPSAGAWIASHLWSHYCFTQDADFLEEKAYPILKGAALFFLNYMIKNPENGYLMTGPSISPENSFKTGGREFSLSMMPTCDRVLVYETFNSCIEASKKLNIDSEFRKSLEIAIAKLPPFKIGKNGTIQEWYEDYELAHPNHRHSSHLLALYPFHQINIKTPELIEAAAKSVHRQLTSENWEDTEWSRANMANFYSRLKNAPEAYNNLKGLMSVFTSENLFTMAPSGVAGSESKIFEFDANEAGPAAIAEMLIQSHEGYIEFLPALPAEWKTGSFKGLCVRGGAVVDLKWKNNRIETAIIKATKTQKFKIKLANACIPQFYKDERRVKLKQSVDGFVSFLLNPNESIKLMYKL